MLAFTPFSRETLLVIFSTKLLSTAKEATEEPTVTKVAKDRCVCVLQVNEVSLKDPFVPMATYANETFGLSRGWLGKPGKKS